MKKTLTGQVDAKQIAQWKEEHKSGIYAIEVKDHIAYFRNPEIMDMNAATASVTKDNPLDFFTNIAQETYIGGSRAIFDGTNSSLTMDFIETVKPKLEGKKGRLLDL